MDLVGQGSVEGVHDSYHPVDTRHARSMVCQIKSKLLHMGFLAAMKLRHNAWQPLLTLRRIEHGLLLPILLHCIDDAGRPMLGPTRPGREGEEFLRTAYHDIPVVVPAIREYWMPQRARS